MDDSAAPPSEIIDSTLPDGTLRRIFTEHQGYVSDKWEHYLSIYGSMLARFVARGEPVRLLEIGVQNGGSLQIWSKYLPLNSTVVGIDIDPACAQLAVAPNITILIGDATNPVTLDRMLANARFDVIIDDGSHRSLDVISAFDACFPRLEPGGIYIIEDMRASYFPSHGGGFRIPGTSMEWLKGLLDTLNCDHFQSDAAATLDAPTLQRLRDLGRQIACITIFDSVALVEKLTREKHGPYRRIMTGRKAPVVNMAAQIPQLQDRELLLPPSTVVAFTPAMLSVVALAREQADQAQRAAEARAATREQELGAVQEQLAAREQELATVRGRLAARQDELAALRDQYIALQQDLVTLRDQQHELAALRERVEQEIEQSTRARPTHERQLSWYQRRLDSVHNEADHRRDQLNATIAEERLRRRQLEIDLQQISAAHNRIISSSSWRATAPLRAVLMHHLQLRRVTRNAIRVTWWLGTFRYSRLIGAIRARAQFRREERLVADSGLFDKDYYLRNDLDAASSDRGPIWHYLVRGWWEGRRPHPLFDGAWYVEHYPDVAKSSVNPLVHFIETGLAQRRNPNPLFDTTWYVTMNPDVIWSGVNPLVHYMTIGAARLADPSPAFSTAWYLDQNPDVAAGVVNPLEHYLLKGRAEGHQPRLPAPDIAASTPATAARIEYRKQPTMRGETALFVSHSADGYLKPHIRPYLEALSREGIGIILIVVADREFIGDEPWLYRLVDGLLVRSNEGYDFSAWAHVLRLHRELYSAEILYLLNDSVIGPVNDSAFHAALERLRRAPADLVGMTEDYERGWHIQSYFLALKERVLQSRIWHQFVFDIASFTNKEDVINAYEVQLAPKVAAAGLTTLALFTAKSRVNQTLFNWRQLLEEGFPFIKVMAIRGDFPGADNKGWRKTLADLGYDTMIVDQVLAGEPIAEPRQSDVRLPRVLPAISVTTGRPTRVVFIGPWNYDNGLGFGARGHLSALMRTGFEIAFLPIMKPFHVHQRIAPTVGYRDFVGPPDIAVVELNPEAWDTLLTETQKENIRHAAIRVGAFIWESPRLIPAFYRRLREVDAVWAPTTYCADIFRSVTDVQTDIVRFPIAVRQSWRCRSDIDAIKEWLGLESANKLLLFSFDSSSSLVRKNPLALVAAFRRSGLSSTGWRLVVKTKLSSGDKANAAVLHSEIAACPGTLVIDRPLGGEEMVALMEAADIYVSPHCSEGFGLTIAEAMAMGKVVVATDYGGSRDFLDVETGFPIRWSPWRLERDEGPYGKGTVWARVDETHLAESLVRAAELSDEERQNLGEKARARIRELLSPEAVAKTMRTSLERILRTRRTP
jgi:glycosyltransferase involved in cell wall biosynthesis